MEDPIKWTRHYDLRHDRGHFRAYCSEHVNGGFYTTLLYFMRRESVSLSDSDWGTLEFRHKTFHGSTEAETIERLKQWLEHGLPGRYELQVVV